jgi:integrase
MASITKQAKGWRAQISVKGTRDSAVRATKAEAQAWAVEREAQMRRMSTTGVNTDKSCQDAFDRYVKEVSAHKRGEKWETTRLTAIAAHKVDGKPLGEMRLHTVTADTLGQWRDMRLAAGITGATINRDFALISHVFTTARREWKWIITNPVSDVRRPAGSPARDRLISATDIKKIMVAFGYAGEVQTKSHRVAVAFLFAIETAMRAGEICGLKWGDITGNVAFLPTTKNGTKRYVPLSKRALELLDLLPRDEDTCFGLTSSRLDALFRKYRDQADVGDLTFHDTRHEAITRLARKIDVLDLARMVGHRDIKQLMVYYNASADSIAARLD